MIAPVSSSMAMASNMLPAVMDHEMESSSPVLARSTTAVEAVAVSAWIGAGVVVGDDGRHVVTVMVIVSSSVLPVVSSTWTVRV